MAGSFGFRKAHAVALVAALALAVGACGGGGDDDEGDSTTTESVEETTTTASASESDSVTIGSTVWFAGFELTFDEATYSADDGTVTIATDFANSGADSATLDATLVLTAGGQSYEMSDPTGIPEVPGGTTGKGELVFAVEEGFTFDDAVLTVGRVDNNQAVVPLGAEGELVTLEPRPLAISGSATAGQLSITVHHGELRADVPETHRQIEAGKLALTIGFDVTNSGTGGGGYAFGNDNLALTLADGTTVAPDEAPIELLGHQATLPDQLVRFVVDDPAAGTYRLLLRETDFEGALEFEIPEG